MNPIHIVLREKFYIYTHLVLIKIGFALPRNLRCTNFCQTRNGFVLYIDETDLTYMELKISNFIRTEVG